MRDFDDFYTDDLGRYIVEHKRLRCPKCGSLKTTAQRGAEDNGDGTATRPHVCKTCACRFIVVLV